MTARPVLIAAGGTGGHVYPALAVAEVLSARSVPVVWLGTRSGIEARVVPAAGIDGEWLDVGGLRGKGWRTRLQLPWSLARACGQAARALRRRRPRALLGMGGFAAGPGGLVAWMLGCPLVIHEQNAVAGLTNRKLARLARRVLEAMPGTFPAETGARAVGNPVRAAIRELPAPAARFGERTGPLRLLVLGGSQGAAVINERLPAALAGWPPERRPVVWHQCGERHTAAARSAYESRGVDATVEPFIDDMASAYAWADAVVARAGALSVWELATAGLGGLLVPYPHAVDQHQHRNAHWLAETGAVEVLDQAEADAERLQSVLASLLTDRTGLLERARAARTQARPEAAESVAAHIEEVAR